MSTATPSPGETEKTVSEQPHVIPLTAQTRLQRWLQLILVFVAGMASLTLELAASRLLAPNFGSSLFVWASLIGLILLYLTVGYYLGGRLADRYPHALLFYSITLLASVFIGLVPLIAQPVLNWSLNLFSTDNLNIFYGSLLSVLLLLTVPMVLLGCISPFAIRLRVAQPGEIGHTAGQLYALSTAGSMLGTFLPVLVLLPTIGTAMTFFACALLLAFVSLLGILVSAHR